MIAHEKDQACVRQDHQQIMWMLDADRQFADPRITGKGLGAGTEIDDVDRRDVIEGLDSVPERDQAVVVESRKDEPWRFATGCEAGKKGQSIRTQGVEDGQIAGKISFSAPMPAGVPGAKPQFFVQVDDRQFAFAFQQLRLAVSDHVFGGLDPPQKFRPVQTRRIEPAPQPTVAGNQTSGDGSQKQIFGAQRGQGEDVSVHRRTGMLEQLLQQDCLIVATQS